MLANYPWLMWGIILGWTGLSIWLSNKTKLGRKLGYILLVVLYWLISKWYRSSVSSTAYCQIILYRWQSF